MVESMLHEKQLVQQFSGRLSRALGKLKTEKQRTFVMEYGLDYDAKRAFKVVYRSGNVSAGLDKLLKDPLVKVCVELIKERDVVKYQVEKEAVISKLSELLHADMREFAREDGSAKPIRELSKREASRVNGFKTKTFYDENGNVEYVETDYKLAPIEKIMDMCMKHKGLFAPETHEHVHFVDFSNLPKADRADPVQAKIDEALVIDSTCERVSEGE